MRCFVPPQLRDGSSSTISTGVPAFGGDGDRRQCGVLLVGDPIPDEVESVANPVFAAVADAAIPEYLDRLLRVAGRKQEYYVAKRLQQSRDPVMVCGIDIARMTGAEVEHVVAVVRQSRLDDVDVCGFDIPDRRKVRLLRRSRPARG